MAYLQLRMVRKEGEFVRVGEVPLRDGKAF